MRRIFYILSFVLVLTCNSEDSLDCLQTSGDLISYEVEVDSFENILVNRDVILFVKEGPEYIVTIETGEHLISDIEVKVVDDQLQLSDKNTCNLVRDYGVTKIVVSAPDIKEIRNSSQYEVTSVGVLNYNNLTLISEDFNAPGSFTVGDFRLEVDTLQLNVITNNISSQYISGFTEFLFIGYYSGAGRFEGQDLIAQEVDVYHRGSNDIIVNPQQSLRGELRGTGNLISINEPPFVEVDQYYIGQLIIN